MNAAVGAGVSVSLEKAPCGKCKDPTSVRVFGEAYHYGCAPAPKTVGLLPQQPGPDDDQIVNITRALRDKLEVEVTPEQAGTVLARWHSAMQGLRFSSGWVGDIGVTAYEWLRAQNGDEKRGIPGLVPIRHEEAAAMSRDLVLHTDHIDPDVTLELGQWLRELDVNGQYLASSSIELGVGEPKLVKRPRSIRGYLTLPGSVRLARPLVVSREQLPFTWRAFQGIGEGAVLALRTVRYLTKHGVELEASEALIWSEHRRHLNTWYELFRDARAMLLTSPGPASDLALALLKVTVTTTLGGWMRSSKNHSDMANRSASDEIICEAGVRQLVHIERLGKAGAVPVGVRRDAMWYPTAGPNVYPAGHEESLQLGKLKTTRRVPVSDPIIAAQATGSAEMMVRAVIAGLCPNHPADQLCPDCAG